MSKRRRQTVCGLKAVPAAVLTLILENLNFGEWTAMSALNRSLRKTVNSSKVSHTNNGPILFNGQI